MNARQRFGFSLAPRRGEVLAVATLVATALLAACGSEPDTATDEDGNMEETGADDDSESDDDDPSEEKPDAGKRDASTSDAAAPRDAASSAQADASSRAPDAAVDARTPPPQADAASGPPAMPPAEGSVCARWKADRANLSEGTWSGNVEMCMAGDMTEEARANALRMVNLYRWMAGLSALEINVEGNRLAQACALMMHANGTITHTPPNTWKCYTEEGAKTAGASSLSTAGAVASVTGYMIDPGNPTTIGHRRWILSNMLKTVGFGSTGRFSCQYQPVSRGAGGKPWVAWPPAGEVPIQAFTSRWGGGLDQTGWTVQSDSVNLMMAEVTVSSGGMDLPVTVTQLNRGYGSTYAFRFNPMGWTTKAGQTYGVKVTGASMPIEYEVKVIDCP